MTSTPSPAPGLLTKPPRLDSVDLLRGLVMVIMAIDHVRDFVTIARFDPADLTATTVGIFLTRWITHFCAPVFVFLAGTGAFLSTTRGKTKTELSRFLLTRGIWLVIAELTIVRFGWQFNFSLNFLFVQVIWVIGVSMIVLAFLVRFSIKTIGITGIVMILLHNLLDGISPDMFGPFHWVWRFLHDPQPLSITESITFMPFYSIIPWCGVMAAGYAFGSLLQNDPKRRQTLMLQIGFSMVALFFVLRGFNIYGDPNPWSTQKGFAFTILSFMNVTKYPPSLLFLLVTLGPSLILLSLFDRLIPRVLKPIIIFGRVPMFYYVVHLYLAHASAIVIGLFQGYSAPAFLTLMLFFPTEYGLGLPGVYVVWFLVVLLLYPVCVWFAGVKRRYKYWWLSYL